VCPILFGKLQLKCATGCPCLHSRQFSVSACLACSASSARSLACLALSASSALYSGLSLFFGASRNFSIRLLAPCLLKSVARNFSNSATKLGAYFSLASFLRSPNCFSVILFSNFSLSLLDYKVIIPLTPKQSNSTCRACVASREGLGKNEYIPQPQTSQKQKYP